MFVFLKHYFLIYGFKIFFLWQTPTFTIVSNAGGDGALVLGKLLEQDDFNMGYDAAKGLLANHFQRN